MEIPKVADFEKEIELLKQDAREAGESYINICAGTLHEMLGDFKKNDARMKSCCQAMYNCMKTKDSIEQLPNPNAGKAESSGFGSRLVIRYLV